MCEILQDDGRPEHPAQLLHDEIGGAAPQTQVGEQFLQFIAGAQRSGLDRDDAAVHGLGDGHELHLAVNDDQRKTVAHAGIQDRLRNGPVALHQFQYQSRDTDVDQVVDVAGEFGRVGRPARPRREQQLAPVEQLGDGQALTDVHPSNRGIKRIGPREHFGERVDDNRESQHIPHCWQHRPDFPGSRTICLFVDGIETVCHSSLLYWSATIAV